MTHTRRIILTAALAALGGMPIAQANDDFSAFPSHPIKILLGAPPGGSTDAPLRVLAAGVAQILKQPVVVENRPGVGGAMPAIAMQTARNDGYTIGVVWNAVFRLPYTVGISWDPATDLSYIIGLTSFEFGTVVQASSPIKSMADFVNAAKAKPGQITYGTPGIGTVNNLHMERIARMSGIQLTHVPFKGSAETLQAVMGGQIDAGAETAAWVPLVKSGKLRVIAVWGDSRLPSFPDVPTLKEQGFNLEQVSRIGLVVPKGTAPAIVAKLHDAFKKAMEQPEYRRALAVYEMTPKYLSSKDFHKYAVDTIKEEKEAMETLGMQRK